MPDVTVLRERMRTELSMLRPAIIDLKAIRYGEIFASSLAVFRYGLRCRGVMDESEHIGLMRPHGCGTDRLSKCQSRSTGDNHCAAVFYGDVESLFSLLKHGKLGSAHGGHPAS